MNHHSYIPLLLKHNLLVYSKMLNILIHVNLNLQTYSTKMISNLLNSFLFLYYVMVPLFY